MDLRNTILAAFVVFGAACGGGGGGGDAAAAPGSQADLGTRLVPGFSIRVERLADAPLGMISVRAIITPEADAPALAAVEAAIAAQQPADADWVAGTPDPTLAHAWTWTTSAAIPAQAHVWVRVTDVDGNTAGSGAQDFALTP